MDVCKTHKQGVKGFERISESGIASRSRSTRLQLSCYGVQDVSTDIVYFKIDFSWRYLSTAGL